VNLSNIKGIGKTSLELLEAAGFHDVEAVAKAGVEELAKELQRANSMLGISKRNPGLSAVAKWIEDARQLAGVEPDSEEPVTMPVNHEATPQVASMLSVAPFALPLPSKVLMENELGVSDIPAGILLNRYSGDLDVRVERRIPKSRQPVPVATAGYVRLGDNGGGSQRLEIDVSKIRSTEDLGDALPKTAAVKTSPSNDRVALLRAPRSSTNVGKDPNSRWFIRGVLHSHPISITVGAVVTLLVMFMVPVAVGSAGLLLLSVLKPAAFAWVPRWLLVFPAMLPLFGLAWLIWGLSGSCRICGQKLFVHRSHLKNSRAHHFRGLGYILPLCIHLLLFRWFRCTHCGTPVRLKE